MKHRVGDKETLYSISVKYDINIDEIRKANNLASNLIFLNQELEIPGRIITPEPIIQEPEPIINGAAYKLGLHRFQKTPLHTLGKLSVWVSDSYKLWRQVFQCVTLELPWLENQPEISCIPEGVFPVIFEYSVSFDNDLWEVKQVPNRSEVKFHTAAYTKHLKGCIGVGREHLHLDADGSMDINYSKETLEAFHKVTKNQQVMILSITTG